MPEQTTKAQSRLVLNKQFDPGLKGSELLSISEKSIFSSIFIVDSLLQFLTHQIIKQTGSYYKVNKVINV